MAEIIGQIIGVVGMILAMLSFQCKKNTNFCILQCFSGAAFAVSFYMLGSITAAILNLFNILRGYAFGFAPEKSRKFFAALLIAVYTASTILTFEGWLSILVLIAQILGTVVMYIADAKIIRIAQVVYTSPAWMTHNIINFSLGGILCEAFNFTSSIIALIRYRKEWFLVKKAESDK